jgi:Brp/Blh family beta-carotene 15,15'-monooxygenase
LFALGYALIAALAITAFLFVPTPTLVVFLALSAVHFGRGEVVTAAERAGRPNPGAWEDWTPTAAHGLVVVGLLLWARPADTDPLVRPLSPWVADAVLTSRSAGLMVVGAAVIVGLTFLLRRGRRLDAAELVLLSLAFALAPPLAAFGLYFGLWHSVRHTGRLLDLARQRRGRPTPWSEAGKTLGWAAAAPTIAAAAAMVTLWSLRDLAGLQAQVAVLLALTFPHAGVVWALDRRQATSSVGRTGRVFG